MDDQELEEPQHSPGEETSADRIARLERTLADLQDSHDELADRVDSLMRVVDELDDRLGLHFGRRTSQRLDLNDATRIPHSTLADSYRAFVEQRLQAVARRHAPKMRKRRRALQAEQVAFLISLLTVQLFKNRPPDEHAMLALIDYDDLDWRADVQQLMTHAAGLSEQIEELGSASPWDFGPGRREKVDPSRQQPWGACDMSQRIKFVVAPGYQVNGVQYCHQLVFTGE